MGWSIASGDYPARICGEAEVEEYTAAYEAEPGQGSYWDDDGEVEEEKREGA